MSRADTLQTLKLGSNSLGLDGAMILSDGLQRCRQLMELDITGNKIGSYGLSFLADGLQHCINLQVLGLSRNRISSDGLAAITVIMKRCRYLQELDLCKNSIGVDGAAVLDGGWQHKSMLTLNLQQNLGAPHSSALVNVERCCSSCDHLLQLYYNNDYVIIYITTGWIPKLVSSS